MELKLAKIESSDTKAVAPRRAQNLSEATDQLRTYKWVKTSCKTVQMIAISGVWRPEDKPAGKYSLDAELQFL